MTVNVLHSILGIVVSPSFWGESGEPCEFSGTYTGVM